MHARCPRQRATPLLYNAYGIGGHRERLRRTGGEVAGEKLGTTPDNRLSSERGNQVEVVPNPDYLDQGTGALSAEDFKLGRSLRISPRPGKPATWRREAASS